MDRSRSSRTLTLSSLCIGFVIITSCGGDVPPEWQSVRHIEIPENTSTGFYTSLAIHPYDHPIAYGVAGEDSSEFHIDSTTGELAFVVAPDYENPRDRDGDNVYELELRATTSYGMTVFQTLSITVSDIAEPDMRVVFPTSGANVGIGELTETTVMVRLYSNQAPLDGSAGDAPDDSSGLEIDSISVNGTVLQQDSVDPELWHAPIEVVPGENTLTVVGTTVDGGEVIQHQPLYNDALGDVGGGVELGEAKDLALDYLTNRLYVIDGSRQAILDVSLRNGERKWVLEREEGNDSITNKLGTLELDVENQNLFFVENLIEPFEADLYRFNLITGETELVYNSKESPIGFFSEITLDSYDSQLYAIAVIALFDVMAPVLVSVDPTSGGVSLIPQLSLLGGYTGLAVDLEKGYAYLANTEKREIIRINFSTGERTVVFTDAMLFAPRDIELGSNKNQLYFLDQQRLLYTDLELGLTREISNGSLTLAHGTRSVSSTGPGTGVAIERFVAMELDPRNPVAYATVQLPPFEPGFQSPSAVIAISLITGDRVIISK